MIFRVSPARSALFIYLLATFVFAALLAMPFASADGTPTSFYDALLVGTSAISVTGLTSVNTAEHFSDAGHAVILAGVQFGGMGIITIAVLLTMSVSHKLDLRTRLLTSEMFDSSNIGQVRSLLITVVATTFSIEAVLAAILFPRMLIYTDSAAEAVWHSVFYAISAFCNAGFSLESGGFDTFATDAVVLNTVNFGVFLGALGFPVVFMLYKRLRRRARLNLHARLTIEVSIILLVLGAVFVALFEWNNPDTLGNHSLLGKFQLATFASGMTRSGGFNIYEMADQNGETLLLMDALMFVGGGSASTAGGIKVTTLAVLILAIVAEARGREHITAHHRAISNATVRVAIAVLMASATIILVATMALMAISDEPLYKALFEALSAYGTVGLSTGITENIDPAGKVVLTVLMFIGRVGSITLASGLAVSQRRTLYRFPMERPIIG